MSGEVLVERRGPIAWLTLNREARMNALSRATVEQLGELGGSLVADTTVRAIVLTGAGEHAFCAGADLKERLGMNEEQVLELLALYRTELGWLLDAPMPTLAAINGSALGGGLELALACDFRIARQGVQLGLPETSLGIIPGAGGTQRLPRIVGEAKAKELILLGRRIDAAEALALNLVHRVCPQDEDFQSYVSSFLAPIAEGAPIAQRAALRALRAAELPLAQGLAAELRAYEECLRSEDRREALLAFQEKRPPRFTGR